MNLDEFLTQAAGHGSCVGLHPATPPLVPPADVEFRAIDAAHAQTLDGLYDAFAQAWHFPSWFGRNSAALDDLMRDLDGMINDALGKPPAPGYLTAISNAHLLLVDEQPSAFSWFAHRTPFYRDYYRDEASPPVAFGLLLSAFDDKLDEVRERWLSASIPVTTVTV